MIVWFSAGALCEDNFHSRVERGFKPTPELKSLRLKCFVSFTPAKLCLAVSNHKEADADDSSGRLLGKTERGGFCMFLSRQQQKVLLVFYLLNEVLFSFNSPSGEACGPEVV